MPRILLCCLMLLTPLFAAAQSTVYRTVDERGNVVFTDTPPAGGVSSKEVEVPPTNTSAPPPVIPTREEAEEEERTSETSVAITQPAPETTLPMGPGNFSVAASVTPALAKGWSVQLFMDGEAQGEAQSSAAWSLTNVFRGEHQLTVNVMDADGKVVAKSEPVVVYVQRPSVIPATAVTPAGGGG